MKKTVRGGGGREGVVLKKRFLTVVISSLTIYVGNV